MALTPQEKKAKKIASKENQIEKVDTIQSRAGHLLGAWSDLECYSMDERFANCWSGSHQKVCA